MNRKKTGIIAILLVVAITMGTLLIADVINIPGLIQTGDYFTEVKYIEIPNPSNTMTLGSSELEDIYSAKVAELYASDTTIYDAGNIEFAYNSDSDGTFVDGYITRSSDATAKYTGDDEVPLGTFTDDDVIIDYYDSVDSYNQALTEAIGETVTYQDLDKYIV